MPTLPNVRSRERVSARTGVPRTAVRIALYMTAAVARARWAPEPMRAGEPGKGAPAALSPGGQETLGSRAWPCTAGRSNP